MGGGEGWFEDPTGFHEYDQLGMYCLPPAAAGVREPSLMVEEMASPSDKAFPGLAEDLREMVEAAAEDEDHETESDKAPYETVKVFYGTNREPKPESAAAFAPSFERLLPAAIAALATMLFGVFSFAHAKARVRTALAACGLAATVVLAYGSTVTTARVEHAKTKPGPQYGGRHGEVVEMGTCEVSIPAIHQPGQLEGPSILRLELKEDPLKHVVLQRVERQEPNQFFAELRSDLAGGEDSILIFIHGYNVTFEDAARRTAQMAYDLKFKGAPMFYSWPSQGNWYRYREDEKHVELAVPHIRKFLLDVAKRSQARSIHLIAHSMGNRALTAALREMEIEAGEQGALFNQVVLAAPDINADIFKKTIAPAITRKAERVTLYASSNDLALAASRVFNAGGPRAGDTSAGPVVVAGIETIDVSGVDTSLLGHSYYGSNESVLDDLRLLLVDAASADQRPLLKAVAQRGRKYWIYGHPKTAARPAASSESSY
jgi:esterase/lipase superfamily enzyme